MGFLLEIIEEWDDEAGGRDGGFEEFFPRLEFPIFIAEPEVLESEVLVLVVVDDTYDDAEEEAEDLEHWVGEGDGVEPEDAVDDNEDNEVELFEIDGEVDDADNRVDDWGDADEGELLLFEDVLFNYLRDVLFPRDENPHHYIDEYHVVADLVAPILGQDSK